jgi:hypothetical protein
LKFATKWATPVGNRNEKKFVTIQAFLEGKTIWGKTIKAFRAIVLPLMVLPWFLGFQQYPLNSFKNFTI